MRRIEMILGNKLIAVITKDSFEEKIDVSHPFSFNLQNLYDACFYRMAANTFDERFLLVKAGDYFCYLKPTLRLEAIEE